MRHYLPAIFALTAIIGGNALLWLLRPSAEPAAPADLFPPTVSATAERRTPGPRPTPADPLSLDLDPLPQEIPNGGGGGGRQALADSSRLQLDLQPKPVIRPQVDKLKLFDPDYGSRGFTSRRWLSEHVGIQGGVGYASEPNAPDDRHPAVGVGLVLTY